MEYMIKLYAYILYLKGIGDKTWQEYTSFCDYMKTHVREKEINIAVEIALINSKNYVFTWSRLTKSIEPETFKWAAIINDDTIKLRMGKYYIPWNWYEYDKLGETNGKQNKGRILEKTD
jgi:hypothetical protein